MRKLISSLIILFCVFNSTSYIAGNSPRIGKYKKKSGFGCSSSLRGYMPSIGNQEGYATTVAWATTYVRTAIEAKRKGLNANKLDNNGQSLEQALIDELRFSPTYIYEHIKKKDDNYWTGGASIEDALNVMQNKGNVLLKELPYKIPDGNISKFDSKALQYRIAGFEKILDSESRLTLEQKVKIIKDALEKEIPLVVSFRITNSFVTLKQSKWSANDEVVGRQALVLVGWKGSCSSHLEGTFELANSWGTQWGDKGYVHISYADFMKYVITIYAVKDTETPQVTENNSEKQIPLVTNPKRYALVIGNDQYKYSSRLSGQPYNDAQDVTSRLKQMGFQVSTITDANRQQMLDEMDDFVIKSKNADLVMLYYSGHGVQDGNENYLVPVDARFLTKSDIANRALSVSGIIGKLGSAKAKFTVIAMDACRSNTVSVENSDTKDDIPKGFKPINSDNLIESVYISLASRAGKPAFVNTMGRNGYFTEALLTHLQNGKRIESIFRAVSADVEQKTKQQQQPEIIDRLKGDLEF